jgi:hypothetical protein
MPLVPVELAWLATSELATSEEVAVNRFVAFMRDELAHADCFRNESTRAAGFSFEPIQTKLRPDG